MHKMKQGVMVWVLACMTVCGCKAPQQEPNDERYGLEDSLIVDYYLMGVDGRYAQCVASMHSCDGTTQAYKDQVTLALKQRNASVGKQKRGVKHVGVERVTFHADHTMANVFLNVAYNDGSQEEVLFPLVLDKGIWRMQ